MEQVREDNQNTLEEWDGIYGGENGRRWTIWHDDELISLFAKNIPEYASVLDVGVGNGWAQNKISRLRPDIQWSGCDFSSAAIELVKTIDIPWADLKVVDLEKPPIPFADQSYSTVMCAEVLEHLTDPFGVAKELTRIAKQTVIITVPRENATDTKYHLWSLDDADMHKMFEPHPVTLYRVRDNKIIVAVVNLVQ